jgi:hypothetical protein
MPRFTYTFLVDDRHSGSRLLDQGCRRDGAPPPTPSATPPVAKLGTGDELAVMVRWGGRGEDAPAHLTGHFMVSAAPTAQNQVMPSPFRIGDTANYLCYDTRTVPWTAPGDEVAYVFPGLVCKDGATNAKYELTFIIECTEPGFYEGRQWSIDPEFDTGN